MYCETIWTTKHCTMASFRVFLGTTPGSFDRFVGKPPAHVWNIANSESIRQSGRLFYKKVFSRIGCKTMGQWAVTKLLFYEKQIIQNAKVLKNSVSTDRWCIIVIQTRVVESVDRRLSNKCVIAREFDKFATLLFWIRRLKNYLDRRVK